MKRILLFVVTTFVLLTGCGGSDGYSVNSSEQEGMGETTFESHEAEADTEASVLPEWLAPYAELGELPKPIYVSGDTAEFAIDDNILFPESNVLCMTKDISGNDITLVNNERDAIIAFVEEIEKSNVIKEEQAVNPDSHLLGYNFSIVLLTSDSEYVLVRLEPFDDGRVDISIEKGENNQTVWIKSVKLVNRLKALAGYVPFDQENISNIIRTVIVDNSGNQHQLSEESTSKVKTILKNMNEATGDYKCPFDIDIVFYTKDESMEAKYCHDSCGILVIQGGYYILNEQDAKWLSELVDSFVN